MAGENDKMVKNVRKSLLDVAKVGGKYFKGTAQLFLASGSELVDREMPTMSAMIETNQDILNDTLKFLRNPVEAINRGVNRALNSKDAKAIQRFAKNAADDLKTGDLYQKDRLRSGFGESIDDLLDNFGDFDMSGFDAGGDYNEDESSFGDSFDAEAKIADMQEDGAATRTAAVISAVGDATDAITATENANAQQNIRLSLKQHAQLMSGVQNMITQQGATLQAVNATATSILDVTREAHQQIMSSMENMTKLLTEIRDNTAPVQQEIEKPREDDEIIGVRGELNIKNYLKRIRKNIDNTFNISGMLGAAGVTDISSLLDTIGDNPWQILTDQLINKIIPEHTKQAMTTTGKNMAAFFPALLTKALTQGKKGAGSAEGGTWKDLIAGFFGVEQRSRSSIDTSMRSPSAQAMFTNRTAMAIEQVMPMWLSKIHSALTGEPVKIYNYTTGKYENVTDVISQTVHSASDLTNRMGIATGNLMSRLEAYQFADPKMREDFMNYAYQYFQEQAERSNFINPYASEEEFKKTMPGSTHKDFYYNLITAAMKAAPESELMALASEQMDARANRNKANVSIHKDLRDSGTMIALASGVLGDAGFKTENLIKRDTRKYKYGLRGEAMGELLDATEAKRVAAGGNRNTNAVVNDMLSLMRRGIITYTYVLGGSLRARTTSEPEPPEGSPNPISGLEGNDPGLNAIFSMLRRDAHEEQAHVDKLAQIVNDEKNRKEASYERMRNRIKEKQKDLTRGLADLIVDPTMDASLILDQQRAVEIKDKKKNETGNANTERLRNLLEGQSKETLEKANEMLDRTGVKGFYQNIKDLANEPFTLVTNGLRTVDAFLFRLLYGEDATAAVYEGSKIPSLMQSFNHNLQAQWLHMKSWFGEHIGKPLKNALFSDDGIMAQIANRLNQTVVNPIKEKVKEGSNRVKARLLGERETNEDGTKGDWSGGVLSESINKVNRFSTDAKSGGKIKVGNLFTKLMWGDDEGKAWKGKVRVIDEDILDYDENGNPITLYNGYRDEYRGIMGMFRRGADRLSEMLFGPDDTGDDHGSREKFNLVKDELHKAFPDMIIGAGVGAIGSLFLPGGPFLGAILGSAGGFVASSEKFKTYLFGEGIEEDQQYYDIKTGEMKTKKVKSRKGALIDKSVYDGIKKFAPKMGIGALAGAIAGGVGLLPFGLGPVIGGVLGSIGGMTAASDQLKKIIFGDASKVDENGNPIGDTDGLLSKKTRESIKKALPAGLAGALGGSAAWGLIANVGLIPGLALLPGGPIVGMIGGLTAAFNHEKIEKFFFSEEEVEETDPETGETKKVKKIGGLFGRAYDFTQKHIFEPAAKKFNDVGKSVQGWFANEVVKPFEFGMKGMKESFERGKQALSDTFKGIGKHIFESVDNTFEKIVNMPLKEFMETKIFKPFNDLTNKIFDTIGRAIGNILSAPFKAIELLFNGTIGGEDIDDRRERRRNERREKRRAARSERRDKRRTKRLTEYEKFRMEFLAPLGIDSDTRTEAERNEDAKADEINSMLDGLENSGFITPSDNQKPKEQDEDTPGTKSPRQSLRQQFIAKREERQKKRDEEQAKKQSDAMWDQYDRENGNTPEPPKRKTLRESIEDAKNRNKDAAEARRQKKEDRAIERSDIRDQLNKQKELDNEKARINAEERAAKIKEREEKKQADIDAKSGDDASGGTGIGRNKSTKGYLKDIASNTKKIFNEIKGQLGGSGWNLAYIKVLLDRQFGAVDDKDLPADMEGSKAVKKKRGIFGKAKDWVGEKLSGLTGVGDVIREKIGGVIDFVATPFRILGGVIGGVKDGFLGLIDFLGGLVGKLAAGAKKLWEISEGAIKGLMNGIGEAFIGVGGFLKETLIGAGEVLKNGVGLVANTLREGAAIITGGIRAGFEMLFDFLPDVASMGWDGLRALGRGALKGAKWAGRTVGGLFGKAKNAIFGKGADKESIIKKYLGVVQVDGGKLDEVPVHVGPGGKVPFPYVNVMGGRAVGKTTNHAIPVYVLGFDRKARLGGIDNIPDTNDQDDQSTPETSAPTQAAPPDPTTLSGMNQSMVPPVGDNNTPEPKSDSDQNSEGANGKMDPRFREYKKTYKIVDTKVRNAKDPGKALDQAIQNAQDMTDVEAIQAVQQLNGVTTNSNSNNSEAPKDKEEGSGLFDMLFGGKSAILKQILETAGPAFMSTGLGKVLGTLGKGLGTLTKSGITGIAKNLPFLAGTVGAVMSGDTDRVVTNVAKQTTGKILPWATDALRIGMTGTAEEVAKSGAAAKLIAWFNGALTKLMGNKAVTSAANGVAKSGKISGLLAKVAGAVQAKFKSIAGTLSGEAATKLLKNANVIVKVASAVWDVTSGAYNAANYFRVSSADTTLGMRFAAGLAKGISGLAFGLIPVEWLATTIWKFFASAESEADLEYNQREQAARVATYNQANGTDLSLEEYNKKFNEDGTEKKGIFKTIGGAIAGGLGKVGDFFGGIGSKIGKGFSVVGSTIGKGVGAVGGVIGKGAKVVGGAVGTVADAIMNPTKFYTETFPKMLGQISGHAFNFMVSISEGTQKLFTTAKDKIGELWGKFTEFGKNAIDFVAHLPAKMGDWLRNTWGTIKEKAVDIGKTAVNFVASIPGRISKWGSNVWNSITDVGGKVRDAVVGFFQAIPKKVEEIASGVLDFGKKVGSAIWNAPGNLVKTAGNALGSIGENFQEGFYSTAKVDKPTGTAEYDLSEEPQYGQGPGGTLATAIGSITRPDAMTSLLTSIGTGLGDSLIKMVKDIYKNRESGTAIFSLIGEGLGSQFLGDMKETEGKTANFSNIISNSVASVITGEPVKVSSKTGNANKKTSIFSKAVEGVKSVASKVLGWFKKDNKDEDETGKGPGSDWDEFNLDNENKWGTGVKNFNQTSGKWNRNSKSMAKTGCGPTAAAMVASAYGAKNANPGEANAMSYRMGMRASDGGTNPNFFSQYANAHGGYGMTKGPVDANTIGSNLRKGQPVVMMGKGGPYGNNMHYMVADGLSGKGNVNLMDPLTGSHKSASMGSLMDNSKDAVYSYGKGNASSEPENESGALVDTADGKVTTAEAQNALVSKMASILGQINYSTSGVQDPDKGTASCASTVGWAYRKVLGLDDMSASSSYQSRDSRFTTIYVKNNSGDEVPLDILQPGDILYQKLSSSGDKYGSMTYKDLVALNADRPLGHTEMYAGNGQDLSHGGSPKNGPVYKDLNQYRRLRTFMVRRYTPFVSDNDVQLATTATAESMEPYANADGTTVTSATAATTAGATAGAVGGSSMTNGLTEALNFDGINSLAGLFEQINKVNSWFDNILGGFTGSGFNEEETNTGGTTDAPANEETGEVQNTGTSNTSTTTASSSVPTATPAASIPSKGTIGTLTSAMPGSVLDLLKNSGASEGDMITLKQLDPGDPASTAWVYLRGMGFTPIATAGVLGNLEAESGIQPTNLQNSYNKKFGMSDEEYTKAVDNNTYTGFVNDKGGYGLAQWTYWNRKQKLYDKAKARGTSVGDMGTQLETLWDELGDGYYTTVTKPMLDATSVKDASTIFLQKFEQPATMNSPATINLRAEMAQRWYDKFANEEVTPANTPTTANADDQEMPSNDVMLDDMMDQFGTGPADTSGISPTQQLLTNEVRTLNKHLEETRADASKESTVAQVTKQITDAVGLDTSKSDPQTKLMETIASSLAVMVEHLAAIRENTEKKEPEKVESAKSVNDRMNHRRPTYPEYPNTVEEPEDVGATIIDKLTSR